MECSLIQSQITKLKASVLVRLTPLFFSDDARRRLAAGYWRFGTTHWLNLKRGITGCPATSAPSFQSTPGNIPEEWKPSRKLPSNTSLILLLLFPFSWTKPYRIMSLFCDPVLIQIWSSILPLLVISRCKLCFTLLTSCYEVPFILRPGFRMWYWNPLTQMAQGT
jgi:hypothetical protein